MHSYILVTCLSIFLSACLYICPPQTFQNVFVFYSSLVYSPPSSDFLKSSFFCVDCFCLSDCVSFSLPNFFNYLLFPFFVFLNSTISPLLKFPFFTKLSQEKQHYCKLEARRTLQAALIDL
jgi:hypothetical protein